MNSIIKIKFTIYQNKSGANPCPVETGSGRWFVDIDSFILNSWTHSNVTWFVFNETKELCSCPTEDFKTCNSTHMNNETDYLCTYPTDIGPDEITYCTKPIIVDTERYSFSLHAHFVLKQDETIDHDNESIFLHVINNTKNNCQHYGGYLLEYKEHSEICPFCIIQNNTCKL
ncbi:unnamed protein product [Schistosoma intercalatum]|nr:unnamed protein product [Schistosoma intercalatum]